MAFGKRGQGAIEYLLLLAASIVVVSIVITFMSTTIGPAQQTGSVGTYEYLCRTLVPPNTPLTSITQDCKCYLGKADNSSNDPAKDSNKSICCGKGDSLLRPASWGCPAS